MVIRYELTGMDLGEVRFAISPLTELTLSLRSFRDPGRYPLHLPWLHEVASVRAGLDEHALLALTNDLLWTPDLLTPRPASPLTRIEDQFASLEAADPRRLVAELAQLHDGAVPAPVTGRPAVVLRGSCTPCASTGRPASHRTGHGCARCSRPTSRTGPGKRSSTAAPGCSPT